MRVMGFLCRVMDDQGYLCICCAQCVYGPFVKTHRRVQGGESTAS